MVKKLIAGRPTTSHSSKQHRSQYPGAGDGAWNAKKVHGRKIHEKRTAKQGKAFAPTTTLPETGSKARPGCFPKAFMSLLPLMLIGANVLIKF